MNGSTSLKAVLPAIWNTKDSIKNHPWFALYANAAGEKDPYKGLPTKTIASVERCVREGTGAVLAYEALTRGIGRHDPAARAGFSELLRQYCALDTMAMVVVWKWWMHTFESASR